MERSVWVWVGDIGLFLSLGVTSAQVTPVGAGAAGGNSRAGLGDKERK
jgi:hypothetical protein